MNKFVRSLQNLEVGGVQAIIEGETKWFEWSEPDGKNGLHYLAGVPMYRDNNHLDEGRKLPIEAEADSLKILKMLLKGGMHINSIHRIPEKKGYFPGTPLWYA